MKVLLRNELKELLEWSDGLAVSLYMPSDHLGDTLQGPVRLGNLLRTAEQQLVNAGQRRTVVLQTLQPARALQTDAEFWRTQGDGLAVFIAHNLFRYYRLPFRCPELAEVSRLFHIRPLVQLFAGSDRLFYVLALSQNSVRLLQCTRDSLRVVTPDKVPPSLAAYMNYDSQERQAQFHSAGAPSRGSGRVPLVVHSQAGGTDWSKDNILRFFTAIDRGLRELLRGEQAPLVIAGVDFLHPLYRQANTYPNLLAKGIEGNTDELTSRALQHKAWTVVQPYFEEERNKALRMYTRLADSDQATNDLERVVVEAHDGHIFKLFVARDAQQWGTFDPEQRKITVSKTPAPGDRDLIDLAAARALLTGAQVFTATADEVPGGSVTAAVLRYPEPQVSPLGLGQPEEVETT